MILSLAGIALQIVVTVTAPETLTVRQPATVTVRAAVRGPVAPMIRPPQFGPLGGVRVEESTRVGGGGTMSRSLAGECAAATAKNNKAVIIGSRSFWRRACRRCGGGAAIEKLR